MSTEPPKNGKTTMLLWANTILTAALLPIISWMGVRLWDNQQRLADVMGDVKTEVAVIRERQTIERDQRIKFEQHLESIEKRIKP